MRFPEQYLPNALKEAYVAHDLEDWPRCKSALDVFFEWMSDEDIQYYDLSLWNYRHLMRWFCMLSMTRLCDEPEGTTARIFAGMVNEQIVNRMPEHLKPKLWDCVENVYPELAALFEVSKTVTGEGAKCVDVSIVAEHLEMSEEKVIKVFEGSEPGKYLVTKDQTYTIQ